MIPGPVIHVALVVVQLSALYVLSSRTNAILHRVLGTRLYLLAALPGVIVHECSHLVACWITRTKVRKVRLFEPTREGDSLVLGYVEHDRTANPFANMLVGSAPFFGGALALWAAASFIAPDSFGALRESLAGADGAVSGLRAYAEFLVAFAASLRWDHWSAYALTYALLSVSTHLAPSGPDLRHAAYGATVLTAVAAAAWYAGHRFGYGVPADIASWSGRAVAYVSVLLTFGLVVTAVFAALVHAVAGTVSLVRRRRG